MVVVLSTGHLTDYHCKDHTTGCTFGGASSYEMTSQGYLSMHQGIWHNVGLYTSNEWPSSTSSYDVGSRLATDLVDYHLVDGCSGLRICFLLGGWILDDGTNWSFSPNNLGGFTCHSNVHSDACATSGSLNLPDIILRYLLILNEGCIT